MADSSNATCPSGSSCCPCKGEMCRMGRTIRWMRLLLLVITALLILAIGIGIGKGQMRRTMGRGMAVAAMRNGMRGPDGPPAMRRQDGGMPGPDGGRGRGDGRGRD